LDFLGLADDGRSDFSHSNMSRQYRSKFIARMYQNPPYWMEPMMRRFRVWYAARPNGLKNFVTRTLSRSQVRAALDHDFVQELRQTFLVDVEAVEKRLDVDLPHWKPQQVLAAN
jgi:hypothetical protein